MTVLLLLSSGPMIVADHAIRHGRPRLTAVMMPITVLLGLAFLALQLSEYSEKLKEFTPQTDSYGSLFFVITGFHGLHVFIGLVMVTVTEIAALMGKFTAGRHERVRMVSIYWHFVDLVWIAIVASLYLAPHLRG
jgi:heme/copper-type cytochrome/quinol oxidase subunit 3